MKVIHTDGMTTEEGREAIRDKWESIQKKRAILPAERLETLADIEIFLIDNQALLDDILEFDALIHRYIFTPYEQEGKPAPSAASVALVEARRIQQDALRENRRALNAQSKLLEDLEEAKRKEEAHPEIEEQLTLSGFFNVPTSPETDLLLDFLISGGDIGDLPVRKKLYSHGSQLKVEQSGNMVRLSQHNKDRDVTIEVSDIGAITGNNSAARKLFVMILQKANEQAIYDGKLFRDRVVFSLKELVEKGIFKNTASARNGFNTAINKLTGFKIFMKTKDKTQKGTDGIEDGLRLLFIGSNIENSQCYVYLNEHFNWEPLTQFYTLIPNYYYSLPGRAGDLLYYVFYLARQNADKISKQGYFNISYRAIQTRLKLPSEVGLNNPLRDIKDVIDKALEDIEEQNRKSSKNSDLNFLPVVNDDAKISEYLNTGYLKVSISGELAKSFINLNRHREAKRKEAARRRQQVTDKAKAISMSKTMDTEKAPRE